MSLHRFVLLLHYLERITVGFFSMDTNRTPPLFHPVWVVLSWSTLNMMVELNFEYRILYGAVVVTLWTCYGALQIVVLLFFIIKGFSSGLIVVSVCMLVCVVNVCSVNGRRYISHVRKAALRWSTNYSRWSQTFARWTRWVYTCIGLAMNDCMNHWRYESLTEIHRSLTPSSPVQQLC